MNRVAFRLKIRHVIALVLILSFVLINDSSVAFADKPTNDYIKEKESEIEKAQQEQKKLQSNISGYKKELQNLKNQKANLDEYVSQIDDALVELGNNIEDLSSKITAKEIEIENVKQELAEAQRIEREQYEAMKVRIRFMYEEGDTYALELLFSSNGFADALNKADYIASISEYDRKKLDEYILNEQLIKAIQEELESQEQLLQEQKSSLEQEQQEQKELQEIAEANIRELQSDIAETAETIESINAKIKAQNAAIEALEKAVEEERKKLENQINYDGGTFRWPVPSCHSISSEFGNRVHPILHTAKFHNGIDIPAQAGKDIVAAYDGEVVAASYTSAMGNYVMIDHGSSIYTIYMHCSKLYVKKGQMVSKGETIAAVGKTGLATGNHLHFTVRKNGEYQNPLNYVSP
ncbi:MAG: peptidoglycan DD-metalloendopeptidase family protein [Lachnospiraceae bacterium]|nr:peptidoglycan DD-metalloendopeptidase family protein [Candidatus Merdinaster equi]